MFPCYQQGCPVPQTVVLAADAPGSHQQRGLEIRAALHKPEGGKRLLHDPVSSCFTCLAPLSNGLLLQQWAGNVSIPLACSTGCVKLFFSQDLCSCILLQPTGLLLPLVALPFSSTRTLLVLRQELPSVCRRLLRELPQTQHCLSGQISSTRIRHQRCH